MTLSGLIPTLAAWMGVENVFFRHYFQLSGVGTEWANCHPGCLNRNRKCYSHLLGAYFWKGRLPGLWAGVCQPRMTTACSLVSGCVNFTSVLIEAESAFGFSFWVRAQTEVRYGVLKHAKVASSKKFLSSLKGKKIRAWRLNNARFPYPHCV